MKFFEWHHIIPKHEWKERFGTLDGVDAPDNLILLTIEQHIEAHKWLWENFGSKWDYVVWKSRSGVLSMSDAMKEMSLKPNKGKFGKLNYFYGKTHSDSSRQKQSEANKGNRYVLGKKWSDESRKRIGEHRKGKIASHKNWIVTIPSGEIIFTSNLAQFCRDHRLSQGAFSTKRKTKGYSVELVPQC